MHVDEEFVSETKFCIAERTEANVLNESQKLLSPGEIYHQAGASTVIIERLGKNQEILGISTGFVAEPNIVISAFESIDGASQLR